MRGLLLLVAACGGDIEDPTPTVPEGDTDVDADTDTDTDADTDVDTDADTDTGEAVTPWSMEAVVWMSGTDMDAEVTDQIAVVGGSLWALEPSAPDSSARAVVTEGAWSPAWSPDKRLLVFASSRGRKISEADPTPFLDLWLVGADGTGLAVLTTGDGHDWSPSWSPDGRRIAFASTMAAKDPDAVAGLDLWLVEVDGGKRTRVVSAAGRDDEPVFSVDGQRLYYTHTMPNDDDSGCAGAAALWQVTLSDGTAEALTDDQGGVLCGEHPSVSPDGQRLYFWDAVRERLTALELGSRRVLPFAAGTRQPWAGTQAGAARVVWVDTAGALWLSAPDGSAAARLVEADAALPRW